jgi:hypothetical protein
MPERGGRGGFRNDMGGGRGAPAMRGAMAPKGGRGGTVGGPAAPLRLDVVLQDALLSSSYACVPTCCNFSLMWCVSWAGPMARLLRQRKGQCKGRQLSRQHHRRQSVMRRSLRRTSGARGPLAPRNRRRSLSNPLRLAVGRILLPTSRSRCQQLQASTACLARQRPRRQPCPLHLRSTAQRRATGATRPVPP